MLQEQMSSLTLFESSFPQRDKKSAATLMGLQIITGLVILWQANAIRIRLNTIKTRTATTACSSTASMLANALLIAGILMVLAPLAVFAVNVSGNYSHFAIISALEETYKAQYIALAYSAIVIVLCIWLHIELKKCGEEVGTMLWGAAIVNIVGCLMLVGFRRFLDAKSITDANLQANTSIIDMVNKSNAASRAANAPSYAARLGGNIRGIKNLFSSSYSGVKNAGSDFYNAT